MSTTVADDQITVLIEQVRAGRSLAAEAWFRQPGACIVCGADAAPYPHTAPVDCVPICAEHRDSLAREYHSRPPAAETGPSVSQFMPKPGENAQHPWGVPDEPPPPPTLPSTEMLDRYPGDLFVIQASEDYESSYPLAVFASAEHAASRFNTLCDLQQTLLDNTEQPVSFGACVPKDGASSTVESTVAALARLLPHGQAEWLRSRNEVSFDDLYIMHLHRDHLYVVHETEFRTSRLWPRRHRSKRVVADTNTRAVQPTA